jgi:hypothetical protein
MSLMKNARLCTGCSNGGQMDARAARPKMLFTCNGIGHDRGGKRFLHQRNGVCSTQARLQRLSRKLGCQTPRSTSALFYVA